ncbi:hypothetical protein D3C85_1468790 [compost metagenome]
MFGGFKLLLQDNQLRLLFEGRRMAECLERLGQLRAAHGHIDLGFFQRRIGIGDLLCADALKGGLHRVELHFARLGGALCTGLALGGFLLFLASQTGVALLETVPRVIAFGGAGALLFKTERQPTDNRQHRGRRQRMHLDAVHRTWRHAEVTTGALIDDHRVH